MAGAAASVGGAETFTLARVGTFRTAFPSGFGCPRQGLAAPSARGRVDFEPWVASAAAGGGGGFLEGLEEFSHVWVIFVFDQNRHSSASFHPAKSFLRSSVKPPWLVDADGRRGSHGVFATRTPHRPNPVGLTVCRLDRVDHARGRVFLSGVDVIDGSAVLDVKPYHPVDSLLHTPGAAGLPSAAGPAEADAGTRSEGASACAASWLGAAANSPDAGGGGVAGPAVHFPSWLPAPRPRAEVRWREAALERLAALQPYCGLYPDERDVALGDSADREAAVQTLRLALEEVLGLDPRTPQSRCRAGDRGTTTHRYWALDFDALSIAFRLASVADAGQVFEVVHVELRGEQGTRSSKAWLDDLRAELEGGAASADARAEGAEAATEDARPLETELYGTPGIPSTPEGQAPA
uniref:TsaA-like domain-containing protein n=1 Tax=Alexandrium monilatum TaxID=311494 RepID=A0A7S4SP20_9DINO